MQRECDQDRSDQLKNVAIEFTPIDDQQNQGTEVGTTANDQTNSREGGYPYPFDQTRGEDSPIKDRQQCKGRQHTVDQDGKALVDRAPKMQESGNARQAYVPLGDSLCLEGDVPNRMRKHRHAGIGKEIDEIEEAGKQASESNKQPNVIVEERTGVPEDRKDGDGDDDGKSFREAMKEEEVVLADHVQTSQAQGAKQDRKPVAAEREVVWDRDRQDSPPAGSNTLLCHQRFSWSSSGTPAAKGVVPFFTVADANRCIFRACMPQLLVTVHAPGSSEGAGGSCEMGFDGLGEEGEGVAAVAAGRFPRR